VVEGSGFGVQGSGRGVRDQESLMTVEAVRSLYYAEPFRPFRVYMVDGRSFDVPGRDRIAILPSGRWIIVVVGKAFEQLDLSLVKCLEVSDNLKRHKPKK
jgi:hypothetical protein